ncbi:protein phosphatase 2C domain-containing protein [Rhodococcus aetherivorans]
MTLVLRYAARSDRGLVRSNNEDSVYAGARLLALADGMGGHAAGEVASQLMIAALAHLDDDEPGGDLLGKLAAAVREGNASIADQVEEEPELDGMGTTLTAILFAGSKLGLAHIGDSRAYLLRDGQLTQITRDDTFVQSLVDEGRITPEQAHTHPQRSLIMRALTGSEVEPTLTVREARAGDRYLVCSDGLSDVVSDETIADTMRQGTHDECADRLIELALRSGGPDNVTVVVADVIDLDYGQSHPIVAGAASADDDEDTPPPNTAAGRAAAMRPPRATPKRVINKAPEPEPKKKRSRLWWPVAAIVVIAVLVGGLFVGRQLIRNNYYVGADDGRVTVLRGIPGDVFGYSLQEPARVGCITDEGDLTLVDPASASCRVMLVDDLWPAAREQVRAGLPSGSLDDTREQMQRLAELDLLPVCTPEEPEPTPGTPAPGPGEPTPAPGPNGTQPTETPAVQPPAPGEPQPGEPAPASQPGEPLPGEPQPGEPQPGEPTPGEPTPGEPAPNMEPAPEPAPQIPGQNCRVGA